MAALGFAIGVVASVILLQEFIAAGLGVNVAMLDQRFPLFWQGQPRRMPFNAAIAFLCCGFALGLILWARKQLAATLIRAFLCIALMLTTVDLIGNLIHLEYLYPAYQNWRMSLGTAVAMLGLVVGIWLALRQFNRRLTGRLLATDRKITYMSAAILAILTIVTAVVAFALLQARMEEELAELRLAMLKNRAVTLDRMISSKLTETNFVTSRPNLQKQLRNIVINRDVEASAAIAQEILRGFLKLGFNAIAIRGSDGRTLSQVGDFVADPRLSVRLQSHSNASLQWKNGNYFLESQTAIRDLTGQLGIVIAQQPIPELSSFMLDADNLGETGDMGLCFRTGERLHCFPQRLRPEAFDLSITNAAGEPLPIVRGMAGETGVIKTVDYRRQYVVAAFGPVGKLGLGMTVKVDLVELYAPIRERLKPILLLLFFLVPLGAAAIRFQVAPLAKGLLDAERKTNAANSALRHQAAALAISEKRFRDILEYAPIGMAIVSPEGRWTDVNRALCDMFGYDRTELEKLTLPQITHAEDAQLTLAHIKESLLGEVRSSEIVQRCIRKDGQIVWILLTTCLMRDQMGQASHFIFQIQDITKAKHAEEEIKQLNLGLNARTSELTVANADLEAFSYSVAHDLRSPLRKIHGFSQIISDQYGSKLDVEGRRYLERVQGGAVRMSEMVDDLLKLAQVGRQALLVEEMSLNSIVQACVEELKLECASREIDWKIGELSAVTGDAGLMKQVFVNLFSNAVKYTRPREQAVIQIGQVEVDGEFAVFVRDNGVGFDMKYAHNLFNVFSRLHKAEEFEGTGIGLATVARIVRKHNGKIWAEAERGRGATFFFTIGSISI